MQILLTGKIIITLHGLLDEEVKKREGRLVPVQGPGRQVESEKKKNETRKKLETTNMFGE